MSCVVWELSFYNYYGYWRIAWTLNKGDKLSGYKNIFYKLHFSNKDPWIK